MVFLAFLTNILTGILVGYLSFTNALASHIGGVLPTPSHTKVTISNTTEAPKDTLGKIALETNTAKKSISKILIEHEEFQRASVIASTKSDVLIPDTSTLSLTETVKSALVNVYCQYKTKQYIRTTTGTGFFINPKGIILTNAHVAQFLLLKDVKNGPGTVDCVIRSGDPAIPKYKAELLYISPTWIFNNADLITEETPRGTGERDYALLYVSKSIDNTPLPTRFPAIPVDTALLSRSIAGSSVVTAGYPAEALIRKGASAKLPSVIASTTVGTLYTFGSNYADIFSISESPVGEQGASGGPIVATSNNDVIGLIVTKGDEKTEGKHSLRALTLSYVDRTIKEETGFSLLQNMQGDVAYRGSIFKKAMVPFLAGILEEKLKLDALR